MLETGSLSSLNSGAQREGPSPEMKHIIVAYESCAIADKLSKLVKFFNEDAACIPPLCEPVDLVSIFETTDHSIRSFDDNYLRLLTNEYYDGNSWVKTDVALHDFDDDDFARVVRVAGLEDLGCSVFATPLR